MSAGGKGDVNLIFDAVLDPEISAKIEELEKQLAGLETKPTKIKVVLDDSEFQKGIQSIEKALEFKGSGKTPLISMSKSFASVKQDMASVISSFQEINKLLNTISKKEFGFNLKVDPKSMMKTSVDQYRADALKYIGDLQNIFQDVFTWAGSHGGFNKLFAGNEKTAAMSANMWRKLGSFGELFSYIENRQNKVKGLKNIESISAYVEEAKAYYDAILPVYDFMRSKGAVFGNEYGKIPIKPNQDKEAERALQS